MEKQKRLGKDPIPKLLIKFSIPAIIGMLINVLYNIVDRIFIGQGVGALAISGVGLTFPFMTILMAFGMLVGIGGAALVSIKLGENKFEEAQNILGNSFILLIIVSLIVTFATISSMDFLLNLFGASETTFGYAKDYITIIMAGAIFNCVGFGLNNSIRSDGSPNIAMMTNLLGAITNIILDYLFIMKFNMGIKGAAYATVIGQTLNTVWVLYYFTKGKGNLKLKKKYFKLDMNIVKAIFAIGMSPFAIQLASSVVNVLANTTLKANGGDYAIGTMSILISIVMIFLMPIFGLNQGSQPIIGYNYGAKLYHRVKHALSITIISATSICIIGAIIVQTNPSFLINIFTHDENILQIGTSGIKIFFLMLPVIGFQIITSNFFQAIGKARISLLLSLSRQVLILIPLLIILPKYFGLNGVWMSYPISDITSTLLTTVFLKIELKDLKKKESEANII